ncbi:MAG: hypothetical protein ACFBSD_03610 [Paracoccaceae bacterium]
MFGLDEGDGAFARTGAFDDPAVAREPLGTDLGRVDRPDGSAPDGA